MENPEEVLQSLDEFAKLKPKDIPRELEEYLSYVAKTGDPVYQWSVVKCLFREKLLNVITDFYETSPTIDLPPCPNVDPFNYETMKNSLLERLDSFPSAPFTVQRLCELLTTPRKEYSRADKFMRAIEKNILVVSTREPGNVRRSDNNGQPELLMNGVMDGRGIELGEAIETVSSDGMSMMHAEGNDVNVVENESMVPVECAGMEEIDMEEQTDHLEPGNSSNWSKEQSEVPAREKESEEVRSTETDEKSQSPKDNVELTEENVKNSENTNESAENGLESPKENAKESNVAERDVEPEETEPNLEVSSSESSDQKVEKSEVEVQNSTTEEKVIQEEAETTPPADGENVTCGTSEEKEELPIEKENEEIPPADELKTNDPDNSIDESKIVTVPTEESNEESVAKPVPEEAQTSILDQPNPVQPSSEAVTSPVEAVSEPNISNNVPVPEETSAKDIESDVSTDNVDTETVITEVKTVISPEVTPSEITPVATVEENSVEKVESPATEIAYEEPPTSTVDETIEVSTEATVNETIAYEEEAMEVDETTPQLTDGEEPMDQTEQPEGQ